MADIFISYSRADLERARHFERALTGCGWSVFWDRALLPGGHLATITTEHVRGGTIDFFERAQECYLRWDPATDPEERLVPPDELPPITDEIDSSPLFEPAIRRRYVRAITYPADDYLDVLRTYSGHRALPDAARTGLLADLRSLIVDHHQGAITKTYLHELGHYLGLDEDDLTERGLD